MSVDLPATGNQSARELVDWCSDLQLGRAIAYLELVRIGQINPGPELETVLGSDNGSAGASTTLLTWTVEEVVAVQNKLGLAICLRANPKLTLEELVKRKPISGAIHTSVFKHRMEVLNSYNTRSVRGGQGPLNNGRESEHCNIDEFLNAATSFVPAFVQSYESGDSSHVEQIGWKSGVSEAWKSYLRGRYSKIYPDFTDGDITNMSCRYLSTTLARFKLGLTRGRNIENWAVNGNNLELSFALPAPGAPAVSPRVFYRTVSAKQTKLHIPFWRAKGYLRVVEGQVKLGLSQGTQESNSYVPGFVEVEEAKSCC